MPGVVIGGGHPYLDPGAYRLDLIFQLAEEYYRKSALHNNLLPHVTIPVRPGRDMARQHATGAPAGTSGQRAVTLTAFSVAFPLPSVARTRIV